MSKRARMGLEEGKWGKTWGNYVIISKKIEELILEI